MLYHIMLYHIMLYHIISHHNILYHIIAVQKDLSLSVHSQLVHRGKAWADHISEPWKILVYVGIYIILSVGLELTVCSLLGTAVLTIGTNLRVEQYLLYPLRWVVFDCVLPVCTRL